MDGPMDQEAAAEQEVLRAEREWLLAHLRLDVAALERLMALDYAQVGDGGRIVTGEQYLASLRSGGRHWDEADSDEYRVRVYGDGPPSSSDDGGPGG